MTNLSTPAGRAPYNRQMEQVPATEYVPAPQLARAPEYDTAATEAWICRLGHVFYVTRTHQPITCTVCLLHEDDSTGQAGQVAVNGQYLLEQYHDDPIAFLCDLHQSSAQRQAATNRTIAEHLTRTTGVAYAMGDVDALWTTTYIRARRVGLIR